MHVRDERPEDVETIHQMTDAAFALNPYSDGTEGWLINELRADGALTISLVAELDGEIVGHVAFSPVKIDGRDCGWFGLGPVCAKLGHMRKGIGSAVIRAGLDRLRSLNAAGCVLLGDPGYYCRFGFEHDPDLTYAGGPPEAFQRLVLSGPPVKGVVTFHPAFEAE